MHPVRRVRASHICRRYCISYLASIFYTATWILLLFAALTFIKLSIKTERYASLSVNQFTLFLSAYLFS